MKKIEEIREFNYEIEEIWTIISDISRSDWVPGVSKISLENDTRIFEMEGMGDLVEKILSCDHEEMELKYSAIKTETYLVRISYWDTSCYFMDVFSICINSNSHRHIFHFKLIDCLHSHLFKGNNFCFLNRF